MYWDAISDASWQIISCDGNVDFKTSNGDIFSISNFSNLCGHLSRSAIYHSNSSNADDDATLDSNEKSHQI